MLIFFFFAISYIFFSYYLSPRLSLGFVQTHQASSLSLCGTGRFYSAALDLLIDFNDTSTFKSINKILTSCNLTLVLRTVPYFPMF